MRDINEYLDAKTVIIIVLSLLMTALFAFSYIEFMNMSDTQVLMDEAVLNNLQIKTNISRLQGLKIQAEANEGKITISEDISISKVPDEAGIITNMQNLTKDIAGTMKEFHFEERTENSGLIEMPFSMQIQTDYYSLIKLFKALKTQPRLYILNGLTITAQEMPGMIIATLDASAFAYPTE